MREGATRRSQRSRTARVRPRGQIMPRAESLESPRVSARDSPHRRAFIRAAYNMFDGGKKEILLFACRRDASRLRADASAVGLVGARLHRKTDSCAIRDLPEGPYRCLRVYARTRVILNHYSPALLLSLPPSSTKRQSPATAQLRGPIAIHRAHFR